MSAAIKTMGLKRICMGCGSRFYDLNKRPITCPDCDAEFTGEVKAKTRRGSKVAEVKEDPIKAEVEVKEEAELAEEEDGVEVVSLEDAEDTSKDEEAEEEGVLGEDTLDDLPDVGVEIDSDDDDDALLDEDED